MKRNTIIRTIFPLAVSMLLFFLSCGDKAPNMNDPKVFADWHCAKIKELAELSKDQEGNYDEIMSLKHEIDKAGKDFEIFHGEKALEMWEKHDEAMESNCDFTGELPL